MKKFYTISILLGLLMLIQTQLFGGIRLQTPLEKSDYTTLSSHADMMAYLSKLDKQSKVMHMEIAGKSAEGREIPALFFSSGKAFGQEGTKKPLVLIFCQQHGNEPSGKEGALMLARVLSDEQQSMLKNFDLILVPQVNPDGSEKGQRRNANGMDLNRNHVILSEPEVRAIHQLFLKYMPEVTLDVHEYNAISDDWISHGFIKDAEEQLGGVTNLNIDAQIIDFTRSVFIPTVGEKVKNAGFTFHRYVVGDPFEGSRMRYSTVEINDGRQSLGIYNTFSFIIEGKRYGDLTTKIRRRAEGQLTAMLSLLQTVAENREKIMKIVSESRKQLLQESHSSPVRSDIQMDYFPDSTNAVLNFPIFNLHTWHHEIKELGNFHSLVRVKKSIEQPEAYVIPADQAELIKLLERHRIKMLPLQRDSLIQVEYYLLKHVTTRMEEEMELPYVDVRVKSELHKFGKGSVIVYLNQPARLVLPLILEPESSFSIVTESSGRKYQFDYLKEGSIYPIFRLVR